MCYVKTLKKAHSSTSEEVCSLPKRKHRQKRKESTLTNWQRIFFVARRENVTRRAKKAHSPTGNVGFSSPEDKTSPEEQKKHTHQPATNIIVPVFAAIAKRKDMTMTFYG